jgi:tripartite-type tricarboxylate transporter receptor subunit TctC
MPNVPYVMEADFTPISVVVNNDELLVVQKSSPVNNVADLIAAAKDPLPWASTGRGSIPHLALEQFIEATGVKFNHVVYRGAAPAINDVANTTNDRTVTPARR